MAQDSMRLSAGTRLGPYEILALLGAGGMGEVYRARDTRLERTVAIKVLPSHLSESSDSRHRFEREARAISALQHPHICVLYDVGNENDIAYLVMEYLEGESLAERLRRGALPLDQVRQIGIEVTAALARAHRAGIVHRDLKPANIMLCRTGTKLMDFGLAKTVTGLAASAPSGPPLTPSAPTLSIETLASPASPVTQKGHIVGTFHYLAPEILRGGEADARSDLFSFGCVIYEMITGRRAFQGESQLSVATAILEKEPEPVSAIQPAAQGVLEGIVRNCLRKDPDERYADAHDVKLQLEMADTLAPAPGRKSTGARAVWLGGVGLMLVAAVAATMLLSRPPGLQDAMYASIVAPEGAALISTSLLAGPVAISPDGTQLVYSASQNQGPQLLWVRRLNNPGTKPLPGTEGATHPFWSGDGRNIGFFAERKLKKVSAEGGPVVTLAEALDPRGGAWNRDGVILFAPNASGPFISINAAGGVSKTESPFHGDPNLITHRYPSFLPDQRHYLLMVRGSHLGTGTDNGVFAGELGKPGLKRLVDTLSSAVYASGYILYARGRSLVAQKLDTGTLETAGDPIPLTNDLRTDGRYKLGVFSASQNGILVYQTGVASTDLILQEVARDGSVVSTVGPPTPFLAGGDPQYWPDGRKALADIQDQRTGLSDIWQVDLRNGTRRRLSTGDGDKLTVAVSPDGGLIAYDVASGDKFLVLIQDSSGAAGGRVIFTTEGLLFVDGWSPDGKYVVVNHQALGKHSELLAVPSGGGSPITLVSTAGNAAHGQVSPNGKFFAYSSDESGRNEVYVSTFPIPSGRWQVSQDGGVEPRWRADGTELFFFAPDARLRAAQVSIAGDSFQAGRIDALFPLTEKDPVTWRYDVSRDGKRFLVTSALPEKTSSQITIITNWTKVLKP